MNTALTRLVALWNNGPALARVFNALLILFAVQGALVLIGYALAGPGTRSADFPLGLQIDPRHGVLHLTVGALAAVAFARPAWRVRFILAFGLGYMALAFLGTFTATDFGMELELPENLLHWTTSIAALAVVWRVRTLARGEGLAWTA